MITAFNIVAVLIMNSFTLMKVFTLSWGLCNPANNTVKTQIKFKDTSVSWLKKIITSRYYLCQGKSTTSHPSTATRITFQIKCCCFRCFRLFAFAQTRETKTSESAAGEINIAAEFNQLSVQYLRVYPAKFTLWYKRNKWGQWNQLFFLSNCDPF